jgi:hypothetical protein
MIEGTININDHEIVTYTAFNGSEKNGGVNPYVCHVEAVGRDGHKRVADFVVHHRYDDGILVLVSMMLFEAEKHQIRVPLGDDGYPVKSR